MENIYAKLHSNQKIVIYEMLKRGIDVRVLDERREIIECTYQGHTEYLLDRDSSIVPYNMSIIAGDKALTKRILLEHGISAPLGESFPVGDAKSFIEAFHILGCPVTIKPINGSHGYDVYTDLNSEEEIIEALARIIKNRGDVEVLIEEYYASSEYRVFITKNHDYAVLLRDPASIIGNGKNTIRELIALENYHRMHPRTNSLCEIFVDDEMQKYLIKKHLSFDFIPAFGEKVYLRPNSNVAMGGICIDFTDQVHPSVIDIAIKTLESFPGLPYLGIDYMTNAISKEQNSDTYRIIEVNTVPGVHMHFRPGIGVSRNIGTYMVDLIFPETKLEKKEEKKLQKSFK